jgi:hypothetical protein
LQNDPSNDFQDDKKRENKREKRETKKEEKEEGKKVEETRWREFRVMKIKWGNGKHVTYDTAA